MIRLFRIACILCLFLLGCAHAALPALTEPPADVTPTPLVLSVAIADIPQQIADDTLFVQELIQRSQSAPPAEDYRQTLAVIRTNTDALQRRLVESRLERLSFARLETLDRHVRFLDEQLKGWQSKLQASTRPLSDDAAQLAVRRAKWRETGKLSEGLLPVALQASVDRLGQSFTQAENAVSQPLGTLLELGRQADRLHAVLQGNQQLLARHMARSDALLWNIDSPNLWSALFADAPTVISSPQTLSESLDIELAFLEQVNTDRHTETRSLLVAFALLLPLFIWLAIQARPLLAIETAFARYRKTLARPISAWLLLLIAALLLENIDGSYLRLQILLVMAWLPVMRLQSQQMHEVVSRWVYATLPFFVINMLCGLMESLSLSLRLCLLLNDALMLATFILLLRRQRYCEGFASVRTRLLSRLLLAAATALMVVAILGNIAGNVYLAMLLTDATLYSMYLGLFLLAARNVVLGYARLLLHRRAEGLRRRTQQAGRLLDVSRRLFNLALAVAWLYGVLSVFRALRPVQGWLETAGGYTLTLGSISVTLGGIVLFCVSVYLSFWLAQTLRSILREDILPSMTLPRGVANSVSTMSYYCLLILGLMVALTAAGFQISQLAMVLGALSVGIGFGLQTVVNNFVSGLILMIERPIQPGDTVEVSGTTGSIRDIGMRTTTLTTFDGADVVVPNGMLLSEKLTNWTLNNKRRRIEIPVGVSYDCDPKQVQALLVDVARQASGISLDPAPVALFMGFGDSSLDFSVRAWTDNYDQSLTIRSDMALAIHAALTAAGIEIPFPQRDLHLRSVDAEALSQLPGR